MLSTDLDLTAIYTENNETRAQHNKTSGLELPTIGRKKSNQNLISGRGRLKGVVNKVSRDLKNGVLNGAIACGYDGNGLGGLDGFLLMCAQRHPKHYMALLGRLMPMQPSADVGHHIETVNILPVASGSFLSHEEIEKARSGTISAPD